jgi:adenylate cyclase class IV
MQSNNKQTITLAPTVEVEIKSLLGDKKKAEEFLICLSNQLGKLINHGDESQLNHYFSGCLNSEFIANVTDHLVDPKRISELKSILYGTKQSIRTRQTTKDDSCIVLLVVKATVSSGDSHNGNARMELELEVNLGLDALDSLLLSHGLSMQAKWSRQRHTYSSGDLSVMIDKNAGYGYLVELETLTTKELAETALSNLRSVLSQTGFKELDSEKLSRMFAHYNENWADYYGTEKTFVIN